MGERQMKSPKKVLSHVCKLFSKEKLPERVQVTFSPVSGINPFEANLVGRRSVPALMGRGRRGIWKRLDAVTPSLQLSLESANGEHPVLGSKLTVTCRPERWEHARRHPVRARCHIKGELREIY